MTSAIELKSPDGTNKARLEHPDNVSKTINVANLKEESDIQTMIENRAGSDGAFSFRNKIVDGRLDFWYESTSKTYTGTSGYGAETMLFTSISNDTVVVSQQAVALGEIPSAPSIQYWSKNVVTSVANAASHAVKKFKIEDVRTLAGKTVTFSFYAKADAVRNVAIEFLQYAGTGGSSTVNGLSPTIVTLSTTATRYSVTATLPSINSMTIGTGSDIEVNIWMDAGTNSASRNASLGQQSGTFYFTGIQLEEGSVATPFEELPIEISRLRVERYFEQQNLVGLIFGGYRPSTTTLNTGILPFSVKKRVTPSLSVKSIGFASGFADSGTSGGVLTGVSLAETTSDVVSFTVTTSLAVPMTQGTKYVYWGWGESPTILNFDARL